MKCACLCGGEFEPKRRNQIYASADHRKKDKNRRWPRVSAEALAAASRNGLGERIEAVHHGGTASGGTEMAQTKFQRRNEARRKPVGSEFLTPRQVTELLGMSDSGLLLWRRKGFGPPFLRITRQTIRYPKTEFQAWLASLPRN